MTCRQSTTLAIPLCWVGQPWSGGLAAWPSCRSVLPVCYPLGVLVVLPRLYPCSLAYLPQPVRAAPVHSCTMTCVNGALWFCWPFVESIPAEDLIDHTTQSQKSVLQVGLRGLLKLCFAVLTRPLGAGDTGVLNSERNVFQKWGTYKGKSTENKMSSAHRPQRPDGGFGHKCSSVPELSMPCQL